MGILTDLSSWLSGWSISSIGTFGAAAIDGDLMSIDWLGELVPDLGDVIDVDLSALGTGLSDLAGSLQWIAIAGIGIVGVILLDRIV